MKIRALLVCDIGFASPYWPEFCEYLGSLHDWDISILSPAMSKSQKKFFGIKDSKNRYFQIFETKEFKMEYRKTAGYSRLRRLVYRSFNNLFYTRHRQTNFHSAGLTDDHEAWVKIAIEEAVRLNKISNFNLLLSTCLPFSSHVIGSSLQRIFDIPWIADFRDPFSYSHTNTSEPDPFKVKKEIEVLASASLCTTTSLGFSAAVSKVYAGPIKVLHNGFGDMHPLRTQHLGSTILISYQGSIYRDFQKVDLILEALEIFFTSHTKITTTKKSIKFRIGGYSTHLVTEYFQAKNKQLPEWIELIGVTSAKDTLKIQRDSDFLLMLNWEDTKQPGVMQTKLYEYLCSGTRIIATGGFQDESVEILTNSQVCTFFYNSYDLAQYFHVLVNSDTAEITRNEDYIQQFSRRNQAVILNEMANQLLRQK